MRLPLGDFCMAVKAPNQGSSLAATLALMKSSSSLELKRPGWWKAAGAAIGAVAAPGRAPRAIGTWLRQNSPSVIERKNWANVCMQGSWLGKTNDNVIRLFQLGALVSVTAPAPGTAWTSA